MLLEHYSFLDGVFMTIITVTTVGYGETHPLDATGEVFTITLILFGVVAFLYTFGVLVEAISSGSYRAYRSQRALRHQLDGLNNHVIVCGHGRTGRQVVAELRALNEAFVVVEQNRDVIAPLIDAGDVPYVVGDATSDEVLISAGVHRARALISAVNTDERTVYITLSARALQPDIYIVARSTYPESDDKLRRAGANRVVSPYRLSGERLAELAMQPAVVDALDVVRSGVAGTFRIQELVVDPAGAALDAAQLRKAGATILALGGPDGTLRVGPADSDKVQSDDIVVAMGTREQLMALAEMLRPATTGAKR